MNISPTISPGPDELITVSDWINWLEKQFLLADLFYGHGSDNAWDEAVFLTFSALNLPLTSDESCLAQILSKTEKKQLLSWFNKRIGQKLPLPYITGKAYFCGLEFNVDSRVLIPRSPIAEMIENYFYPWLQVKPTRILDLCTGSACIAIACAYAFPDAIVDASDLSSEALIVAEQNKLQHKLNERLNLYQGDLFQPLQGKKYQLIVSNPPYVDKADMDSLPDEFKNEPEMALAAGNDGLDLVRLMLEQAGHFLADDGLLVIEVGNSAEALENSFPNVPFTWVEFENGGEGVFVLTAEELKQYF